MRILNKYSVFAVSSHSISAMGSAAVEAGLISPIALIAVSIAGVCGFVLPNRDVANAVRLWRFGITLAAWVAGLWGVAGVFSGLIIHLLTLKSLGYPYLTVRKEAMIRPRLNRQKWRNKRFDTKDEKNQK
jgi:hypothetical protein